MSIDDAKLNCGSPPRSVDSEQRPTSRNSARGRRLAGLVLSLLAPWALLAANHAPADRLAEDGPGVATGAPALVSLDGLHYGNGAYCTAGGTWVNASSRAFKQDIKPISTPLARTAVQHLLPVTFRYKNEVDETYAGFIAEDVPDLVATKDRQGVAAMDVVAVLTKVVQDQDRQLSAQQMTSSQQQQLLAQQQQVLAQQQAAIVALTARMADLETCCGKSSAVPAATLTTSKSAMATADQPALRVPFFGALAAGSAVDPVKWFSQAGTLTPVPAAGGVDDSYAYRFQLEGQRAQNLPAVAVANGTVTSLTAVLGSASSDDPGSPGSSSVLVDHGSYYTGYRNLKSISVKAGDKVYVGQTLGTIAGGGANADAQLVFAIYRKQPGGILASEPANLGDRDFYLGLPKSLSLAVGQTSPVNTRVPFFADKYSINDPYYARSTLWTSSAAGVATVDSHGLITAVAPGTATITLLFSGTQQTIAVTVQ